MEVVRVEVAFCLFLAARGEVARADGLLLLHRLEQCAQDRFVRGVVDRQQPTRGQGDLQAREQVALTRRVLTEATDDGLDARQERAALERVACHRKHPQLPLLLGGQTPRSGPRQTKPPALVLQWVALTDERLDVAVGGPLTDLEILRERPHGDPCTRLLQLLQGPRYPDDVVEARHDQEQPYHGVDLDLVSRLLLDQPLSWIPSSRPAAALLRFVVCLAQCGRWYLPRALLAGILAIRWARNILCRLTRTHVNARGASNHMPKSLLMLPDLGLPEGKR